MTFVVISDLNSTSNNDARKPCSGIEHLPGPGTGPGHSRAATLTGPPATQSTRQRPPSQRSGIVAGGVLRVTPPFVAIVWVTTVALSPVIVTVSTLVSRSAWRIGAENDA
jgi:hypothetical protein